MDKGQQLTKNIGHLADSANLKACTSNKTFSGLLGWSYEMPNAPYSNRYA